MEHITDHNIEQTRPSVVTLGNFDGIHKGHRVLIDLAHKYAAAFNYKSIVFTFNPHPMFYFNNRTLNKLIMSRQEKAYSISKMGIDEYIEYPFDKALAGTSPEDFAIELLFKKLKARVVIVGENFRFGTRQTGTPQLMARLGVKYGVKVIAVPSVDLYGYRVSSTRVRKCLVNTNVELANLLLTEPYFMIGRVTEGKKLGRQFGFPTVNIEPDPVKLFPPNGVYATRTEYKGKVYSGVTNVGINPTVNGTRKVVETFLFDFDMDIYGEELKINFFKFIRHEKKFNDVEELMSEIARNSAQVKEFFDSPQFYRWKKLGY